MATKKKSEDATPSDPIIVCWTGEKFVSMPNDLERHAQMTMEQIKKQPEAVWDEENNQWGLK